MHEPHRGAPIRTPFLLISHSDALELHEIDAAQTVFSSSIDSALAMLVNAKHKQSKRVR
jgi:hypothetical protein